jgi:hypothetical protein
MLSLNFTIRRMAAYESGGFWLTAYALEENRITCTKSVEYTTLFLSF